ncbi:hypothetical protein [Terrabacter sp. BE26]|uniref:hypothetical protein n=1 Tax=Terrabacter sp. BE26 TaxID=2898152 RepID=UPI0035BE72D0
MPWLSTTIVPSDELAVLSSVTSGWTIAAGALVDDDVDDSDDVVDDDPAAGEEAAGVDVSAPDEPQAAERRRTVPARATVLKDRARIMSTSSRGTPGVTSERENGNSRETVHVAVTVNGSWCPDVLD